MKIDALACLGHERARRSGPAVFIRRNDHKERHHSHGDERLRSQRMAFHQCKVIGQGAHLGIENAYTGLSVCEIQCGPIMIPSAFAHVDNFVGRTRGIKHIAKGGKGIGRDGFDYNLGHGKISIKRNSAMRSTCLQASANSVAVSWLMRRSNAARIDALSWSRTAMINGNPCFAT